MQIYFTEKEHRAFERLMKGKPGFDHYDSKVPGADEDCRTCRSYRPGWKDRFCEYQECPFAPGRSTALAPPAFAAGVTVSTTSATAYFQTYASSGTWVDIGTPQHVINETGKVA